jgi:hypothetical protein
VCFSVAFLLALAASAIASEPATSVESDVQRSNVMQRLSDTVPSSVIGFAEPSPGDSDLGEQLLLTPQQRYKSLYFYAGTTEFFTSDATLVDDNFGSDWFTMLQAGLNWTPHLGGNLYGEAFVRQDFFRYARYPELNFNSTNLGAGLIYVIRPLGDLSIYGRYGYTFLTDAAASTQIFDEQFLKFGFQKPFPISRAHTLWLGSSASINLAGSPSFALRDQFSGYASYQLSLTRSLSFNAFYQVAYFPFREGGRADWNQIVSGSLSYQLWEWFTVSSMVSGAFNTSNDDYYNYSALNVGIGLNAAIQF